MSEQQSNEPLANYGLMDIVAGLEWVQRNIAAFGNGKPRTPDPPGSSAALRAPHGGAVPVDGAATVHESARRPIGLWPDTDYAEQSLALTAGARIFLYTDGLSEERNPQGDQFGDVRMLAVATSAPDTDLEDTVETLVREVAAWGGGHQVRDDVAIVAVEMVGK